MCGLSTLLHWSVCRALHQYLIALISITVSFETGECNCSIVEWLPPKKICPCPDPWKLCMWLYVEKVSLPMWLSWGAPHEIAPDYLSGLGVYWVVCLWETQKGEKKRGRSWRKRFVWRSLSWETSGVTKHWKGQGTKCTLEALEGGRIHSWFYWFELPLFFSWSV